MPAGRPVLCDPASLVGFMALSMLPAAGLYLAGWLLWSAVAADWTTITGWLHPTHQIASTSGPDQRWNTGRVLTSTEHRSARIMPATIAVTNQLRGR